MSSKKEKNATVATKNICEVYGDVLDVRKCQRWFARFRSGDLSLEDSTDRGRHRNRHRSVKNPR